MTRQARSDSTRGRVLDGALELFGETSSVEVPVRLLSARSGVSVGSIYHHFGDMAGVSAALYSRCMCALLDHMLASVPAGGRLEALVGSTVRSYLDWTRRNILEARFIHASAFAPFAAAYREDIRKEKAGRMERLAAGLAAPSERALSRFSCWRCSSSGPWRRPRGAGFRALPTPIWTGPGGDVSSAGKCIAHHRGGEYV